MNIVNNSKDRLAGSPVRAGLRSPGHIDWSTVSITEVWEQLGGPTISWCRDQGRSRAWWRDGDNGTAVSIDRHRNVWHDFVTGDGGGSLRLVEVALGVTRGAAVEWIASRYGSTTTLFDERGWRTTAKLREYALLWHRRYLRKLELAKEELHNGLTNGDRVSPDSWQTWLDYTWCCGELYRVECLNGPAMIREFEAGLEQNPTSFAALIKEQLEDEEHATRIVAAIVAIIEAAASTSQRNDHAS